MQDLYNWSFILFVNIANEFPNVTQFSL